MAWMATTTTGSLYPREKPGTNFIGRWVGHRTGLNGYRKSYLHTESIPGPSKCSDSLPGPE